VLGHIAEPQNTFLKEHTLFYIYISSVAQEVFLQHSVCLSRVSPYAVHFSLFDSSIKQCEETCLHYVIDFAVSSFLFPHFHRATYFLSFVLVQDTYVMFLPQSKYPCFAGIWTTILYFLILLIWKKNRMKPVIKIKQASLKFIMLLILPCLI
jgi:hypothetical protein